MEESSHFVQLVNTEEEMKLTKNIASYSTILIVSECLLSLPLL